MKKYKVICITSGSTVPPEPDRIEREITAMTEQGWDFLQITSGGGGTGSGNITSWIYLIFKSES
jgi:molybdopterin biosynthesis enzyme MoaB